MDRTIPQDAATAARRRRCIRAVSYSVALCTMLAGCSTAFDKRPIANDLIFGIPFEARLEGVYIARTAGPSDTQYSDVATAAARYQFAGTNPVGITISLLSDLATNITGAVFTDTERRLSSARCVYVLRPDSNSLATSIRERAITVDKTEDFLTDFMKKAERDSRARPRDDDAKHASEPPSDADRESDQEEAGSKLISLSQICNPDLTLGEDVMVTITSSGGTIHPSKSDATETVGDVMRRRGVLPPLQDE